ncbi:MAG TPA: AMP-binding protein [Acidimicrobiia bacterium]|nr:AMP-binding protein [Acidimicrobiia bacterium]
MTKSIDVLPTWYWPDGVPRYLSPPRSSVYATTVERWARRNSTGIALRGSRDISYGELDGMVKNASARLRQILPAGQNGPAPRMAIVTHPDVDSAIAMLGALHAGADTLLLDQSMPAGEVTAALTAFGCRVLVTDRPPGSPAWETIAPGALADPPAPDAAAVPESRAGRWAFHWERSFALQPNAVLLGWALAFRAFAGLRTSDLFPVFRGLSQWEGVVGLLAPLAVGATCLLSTTSFLEATRTHRHPATAGSWLAWSQAEAILEDAGPGGSDGPGEWIYVSVDSPIPVRKRRRLGRLLGAQVLTVFGTPATGPVAASPREWSIDEAVGTPITGVDLVPLDETRRPAEPPWHLLASARVGVKSSFFGPGMEFEGPAADRYSADGVLDTAAQGRVDANGLLYLL